MRPSVYPVSSVAAVVLLFAHGAAAQTQTTFTRDVAPILQRACQGCHRPGNIAPMSLLTYDEARPWAKSIKVKVADRDMPPWYIDRRVGIQAFKDDPSLTDVEIATIVRWVDAGAPRGDPADMPAPRQFDSSDRWHIGKPDLVVALLKERVVKANAPDQWINVPMEDPGITEDRYIQAVEIKAIKGVKTLHHADASMHLDDEEQQGEFGTFLVEYAVGKYGDVFPEGSGRLLKAGTKLMMNLHLHAVGQDETANVALGLKLYPKGYVPKHVEITQHIGDDEDLDIAAGAADVRADGYTVLTKPTRLTSFQPHLHNRGKAMCLEAIFPTGTGRSRRETISCVDRFRFGWHIVYHYADDAQPLLPAGTILHVIGWHDNSRANRYNPDPTNWIGFGQRTIDDMSFAWMSFYYLSDDEYRQMTTDREAKKTSDAR